MLAGGTEQNRTKSCSAGHSDMSVMCKKSGCDGDMKLKESERKEYDVERWY